MKFDLTLDLLDACKEGNLERVSEVLLVTSDHWKSKGEQVSYQAVCSGKIDIVTKLFEHGLIIPEAKLGRYLTLAVQLRSVDLVNFFITQGGDINYQDNVAILLSMQQCMLT